MKKSFLIALSSAVLLAGVFVVPANAAETVNCTTGGTNTGYFTISGTTVVNFSLCAGTAAIPDSVTSIGNDAFNGATDLTQVTFGDGSLLSTIGASAFADTGLTSINVPSTVTTLGAYSFALNPSLTTVSFGDTSSLESIGDNAFDRSGITSITIPAGVTSLGYQSFYETRDLTTISFSSGSTLETIGEECFVYSGITSIEIPASVSSLGVGVFERADYLENVSFASGSVLTSIPASLFHYSGLSSISLPAGLTTIGASAFYNNQNLTTLTIPASVVTIGNNAFGETNSLTTIRFEGLAAPGLGTDAFTSSGPPKTASIKYNATGFDLVSGLWNGLLVSRDAAPAADPAPVSSPAILVPVPQVTTPTPDITKSFFLDSPVLANQQKKGLRKLVREVGEGSRFEVVSRVLREPGQTKKQANALALAKARAIKKYLVARGVKKKDVSIETEVFRIGTGPETKVLGFKPDTSS